MREFTCRQHGFDDAWLQPVEPDHEDARARAAAHFFPKSRAMARPVPFTIATVRCQNMTATPTTAAMAEARGMAVSGPM